MGDRCRQDITTFIMWGDGQVINTWYSEGKWFWESSTFRRWIIKSAIYPCSSASLTWDAVVCLTSQLSGSALITRPMPLGPIWASRRRRWHRWKTYGVDKSVLNDRRNAARDNGRRMGWEVSFSMLKRQMMNDACGGATRGLQYLRVRHSANWSSAKSSRLKYHGNKQIDYHCLQVGPKKVSVGEAKDEVRLVRRSTAPLDRRTAESLGNPKSRKDRFCIFLILYLIVSSRWRDFGN